MSTARWLRIKDRAGRALLAALAVSAVAGVFWYRHLDIDEQPPPSGFPANDSAAEMVTRDFRHVETRMDRTIWVLESDRAEVFEDKASLHGVKVTWYGEPGEVTVIVTSTAGTVDFRERTAELRGAVRVERADGAVLTTDELFWDEKTKLLKAPSAVVITTATFTFRGTGLDANLASEQVLLRGRVQGEIRGGTIVRPRRS